MGKGNFHGMQGSESVKGKNERPMVKGQGHHGNRKIIEPLSKGGIL